MGHFPWSFKTNSVLLTLLSAFWSSLWPSVKHSEHGSGLNVQLFYPVLPSTSPRYVVGKTQVTDGQSEGQRSDLSAAGGRFWVANLVS